MVKTRKSMDGPTVIEVTEPKVADLPEEKSAAALPEEAVPKMTQEDKMPEASEPDPKPDVVPEQKEEPAGGESKPESDLNEEPIVDGASEETKQAEPKSDVKVDPVADAVCEETEQAKPKSDLKVEPVADAVCEETKQVEPKSDLMDNTDTTLVKEEHTDNAKVEEEAKMATTATSTEEADEAQSKKRHIDKVTDNMDDEETLTAKKLKTVESGDQEVPAPLKKVTCEE